MKNRISFHSLYCVTLSVVFLLMVVPSFGKGTSSKSSDEVNGTRVELLNLDACIATALKNNPDLQYFSDEKNSAEHTLEIAESERWPDLTLKGGVARYTNEQRLVPTSYNGEQGVFGKNMSDIGVTVRMPLFVGGRITHAIHAAELNDGASGHRFVRNAQELTFNVVSAFYTILSQRHRLKSIAFSKDVLDQDRRRIEALIHAQKAAPVDLMRIDVRLAQVNQQKIQVHNEMHVAYRILYNLMGLEVEAGDEMPSLDGGLVPLPPAPATLKAFESALINRPDYLELQAKVEAQSAKVAVARGQRWPSVYMEGGYGYRIAGEISDNGDGQDSSEEVGSIGLRLEMPLFEGGRIQAEIRREQAKTSALRQKLRALRLRIQREVETSVFAMDSSRRRVETQEAAIAQGREVLRIEQEKYRLGKGTILDVLDSQGALLDVETAYYQALADYHIATHRFFLARGDKS